MFVFLRRLARHFADVTQNIAWGQSSVLQIAPQYKQGENMNIDSDVETLADVLFEALSISSSIRRQAGSDSELGRLMIQLHDAVGKSARALADYQLSLDQLHWCATCGHRAVEIIGDETFCNACTFAYDKREERV